MYLPLLSRENSGKFHVNAIQTKMGELLEAIVREARTRSFEDFDRELKRQRQTISDLKESIGMIQRQLRNAGVNLTPQPIIRTSPRDIRNFRKRLGVTQEVFAQMLHVNIRTVIRWENDTAKLQNTHKEMIRSLKSMKKNELERIILEAKTALYK
jgi:DNA-binding transcriptional regulator YiaG